MANDQMAPSLADFYAQTVGSLEPFTRATNDPYAIQPSVGQGLPAPNADPYMRQAMQVTQQVGMPAQPQPQQQMPRAQGAPVWYNPSDGSFNINGYVVEKGDDSALATADQMLSGDFGGAAPAQGSIPLDMGSFQQLVGGIKNPSKWKLFKKNVGIGIDQLQQLGGYGLQLMGAEELGKNIVAQQERDLEKSSIYNRNFTDIKDGGDVVDWFIANLGQQVPNLALSAASGGVGGLVGGATRGALVQGLGRMGLQMAGKKVASKAVLDAAKKYTAGQALSFAEKKLLTDAATAAARNAALPGAAKAALAAGANQARIGGAMMGAFATNYGMGAADVYGETVEADDPSRMKALALAVPYALAETAPEVLGATALFKPGKAVTAGAKAAAKSPASMPMRMLRNTGNTLGRFVKGAATGIAAEGSTEAFQEGLLVAANPNLSFSDPEVADRMINSFAGGAGIGALFGGVGNLARARNLKAGRETSLLDGPRQGIPYGQRKLLTYTDPNADVGNTQLLSDAGELYEGPVDTTDQQSDARKITDMTRGYTDQDTDLGQLHEDYGYVVPEDTEDPSASAEVQEELRRMRQAREAYDRTPINENIGDSSDGRGDTSTLGEPRRVIDDITRKVYEDAGMGSLFRGADDRPVAPAQKKNKLKEQVDNKKATELDGSLADAVAEARKRTEAPQKVTNSNVAKLSDLIDKVVTAKDELEARNAFKQARELYVRMDNDNDSAAASFARYFDSGARLIKDQIQHIRDIENPQVVEEQVTPAVQEGELPYKSMDDVDLSADDVRYLTMRTLVGSQKFDHMYNLYALAKGKDKAVLAQAMEREWDKYTRKDPRAKQLFDARMQDLDMAAANINVHAGHRFQIASDESGKAAYSAEDHRRGVEERNNRRLKEENEILRELGLPEETVDALTRAGTPPAFIPEHATHRSMIEMRESRARMRAKQRAEQQAQANKRKQAASKSNKLTEKVAEKKKVDEQKAAKVEGVTEKSTATNKLKQQVEAKEEKAKPFIKTTEQIQKERPLTELEKDTSRMLESAARSLGGKAREDILQDIKRRSSRMEFDRVVEINGVRIPFWDVVTKSGSLKINELKARAGITSTTETKANPVKEAAATTEKKEGGKEAVKKPAAEQPKRESRIKTAREAVSAAFKKGSEITNTDAATILDYLKDEGGLAARDRRIIAKAVTDAFDELGDAAAKSDAKTAFFTAAVNGSVVPEYRGKTTPVGTVLNHMGLTDEVIETKKVAGDALVSEKAAEVINKLSENAAATSQAWEWIRDLASPGITTAAQRIISLDTIAEMVGNGEISANEMQFITDKLGVGDIVHEVTENGETKVVPVDGIDEKLFDKYEGDRAAIMQADEDGNFVVTDKDGNITTSDKNGNLITVDKDGNVIPNKADNKGIPAFLRASDDKPVGKPFSTGRVTLAVKGMVSKMAKAPNVHVYANLEDLKARNPKLYAEAAKARADGAFDSTNAIGYSYGDNVVLFSDNIYTNEQLHNVLAHEAIGHYGLRSIMDQQSFNQMLKDVYNSSEEARNEVRRLMDAYGISQAEATEEYLANKAADLDMSLLRRIWASIKKFLNKLGCTFDDDMALAVISQARRYVMTGRLDASSKALGANVTAKPGRFMTAASIVQDAVDNVDNTIKRSEAEGLHFEKTLTLNNRLTRQSFWDGLKEFLSNPDTRGARIRALIEGAKSIFGSLRTLDNLALDCVGLEKLHRVFQNRARATNVMMSRLEQMTPTHRLTSTTTAQKDTASKMLAFGTLYRSGADLGKRIGAMPSLVVTDENGNRRLVSKAEQEKFLDYGILTPEEFSQGITYKDSLGEEHTFKQAVTKDSTEYKIYKEFSRARNQAAIYVAESEIAAADGATEKFNKAFDDIFDAYRGSAENEEVIDAAKKIADVFMTLRDEAVSIKGGEIKTSESKIKLADELLQKFVAAAKYDKDGKNAQERSEWEGWKRFNRKKPKEGGIASGLLDREDLLFMQDAVKKFEGSNISAQALNRFRQALKNRALSSMAAVNAERKAKETIARGYVPFVRRGDKQLVMAAYDRNGNRVILDDSFAGVVPRYHGSRVELENIASSLGNIFAKDKYFKVMDNTGNEVDVRFVPEMSDVEHTASLASGISVREFTDMLETLNIDLDAIETERMVRALADASNSAFNRLHRAGNPGFDPNMLRNLAEYMEGCAHTAGAMAYQYELTDLFNDNKNWYGDKQLLNKLANAVKNARTDDERRTAQRNYDAYARKYMNMAPESRDNQVMLGGKMRKCLGKGNMYKEKAKELMRWQQNRANILRNSNDILSSEFGSKVKAGMIMMHLGGSVAASLINLTSIMTNTIPYFAYYNKNTAFGLGHGMGKATAATFSAMNAVKDPRLADLTFLEKIQKDGTFTNYGLNKEEINFLVDQTKNGILQAAQVNHLMGEARGKIRNNIVAAGVKGWMSMFSYTEELNRRATALAAFRLERGRGVDVTKAAETAAKSVDTTQGDYNLYNRPALGRHNLGQYMYMYKQFVVTSMQLLKNMDAKGKATYLGLLFLLSGFKGLPFADDAMDIIDTLCQAFGIKMGSVEEEAIKMVDSIAPGMAPYFMRGVVDKNLGITLSTRTGMGDLLPLTGALKAGADPWREAQNFMGPVASGLTGTVGMAMSLGRYGLEKAGIREGTTTFNQILRESPVAAFRMLGDAAAYASDGTVTNMTGAVVTKGDISAMVAMRLLGFYPASATLQNDIVRLAKQKDAYIKETKAAFIGAYVRAYVGKDQKEMARITRDVNEYNMSARRVAPDMQINDFLKSARRAVKAAMMPTGERHLKTSGKGTRASEEQLLGMYGYAPGDLNN